MRGDGDGWATGPDGIRHWGKHGAAGLLLRAPLEDGSPAVLLQHRAAWSHQGGTWALPGGARDSHESAVHAAVREAHEETGIDGAAVSVRAEVITMRVPGGWTYTTVIADAERPLPTVPNGESTELRWVREADVESMLLHPGFEAGWSALNTTAVRLLVDTADELGVAGALPRLSRLLPRTIELPEGGFGWLTDVVTTDRGPLDQSPGAVLALPPSTVLRWLDLV